MVNYTTKNSIKGLMIAAPKSGSGKTVITLALLRALQKSGNIMIPAKTGPDYIDPQFHEIACHHKSINLDPWSMSPAKIKYLVCQQVPSSGNLIIESMMGLFDGAMDGKGSSAELAILLNIPVVLVVDVSGQSQSVAALIRGFRDHLPDLDIAGVILNRIKSMKHLSMIMPAIKKLGICVLGQIRENSKLHLPSRHLGLIQAHEQEKMDDFIEQAADIINRDIDITAVIKAMRPLNNDNGSTPTTIKPPGQKIAVARDVAFSFCYNHILQDWYNAGASIDFFSPLEDQSPSSDVNAIYLPGGYPELYCEQLSNAKNFRNSMHKAATHNVLIYGECGGYMVLGKTLEDSKGKKHNMLGLLDLKTSFLKRKLHLGYRIATPLKNICWPGVVRTHEFHYASILDESKLDPLFKIHDACGDDLGTTGVKKGSVLGSFLHIIDCCPP